MFEAGIGLERQQMSLQLVCVTWQAHALQSSQASEMLPPAAALGEGHPITPGHGYAFFIERERSLLTTYWSESTQSSKLF